MITAAEILLAGAVAFGPHGGVCEIAAPPDYLENAMLDAAYEAAPELRGGLHISHCTVKEIVGFSYLWQSVAVIGADGEAVGWETTLMRRDGAKWVFVMGWTN